MLKYRARQSRLLELRALHGWEAIGCAVVKSVFKTGLAPIQAENIIPRASLSALLELIITTLLTWDRLFVVTDSLCWKKQHDSHH